MAAPAVGDRMSDLLYITNTPEQNHIRTLKQIREILAVTDNAAEMRDAQNVWDVFNKHGFAFVGLFNNAQTMENCRDKLEAWGYESKINLKLPEESPGGTSKEIEQSVVENEEEPEIGVEATALVLMANCDGNPLRATALAIALSRTTGATALYDDVVMLLRDSFPWLTAMMKSQEMLVAE
jgi:hypothetical protein